jgi:hypothetical protein
MDAYEDYFWRGIIQPVSDYRLASLGSLASDRKKMA